MATPEPKVATPDGDGLVGPAVDVLAALPASLLVCCDFAALAAALASFLRCWSSA